jgi:hypothetical protein
MTDLTDMLPRRQTRVDRVLSDIAAKAYEAEREGNLDLEALARYWDAWRAAEARSEER